MTEATALTLDGFGVAFGERVVLANLNISFPRCGLTVLVGPAGSGKSTLLRTLAGLNDAQPALRTWGQAVYWAKSSSDDRPALVMQHARFLTASVRENLLSGLPERSRLERREQDQAICELLTRCRLEELHELFDRDAVSLPQGLQRRLAIARALSARPGMMMVDEPTAGLSEADAAQVVELLCSEAERRSIVFVTHNQAHARAAGGTTALLAGGRVLEHDATERFFGSSHKTLVAAFVRHGGCVVAGPMAKPEDLAEGVAGPPTLPPAAREVSRRAGPRGFYWLKPGQLGGLPRPGIVNELDHDLDALRELGVTVLVSLEEKRTISPFILRARGFTPYYLPTPDMGVPSMVDTIALCQHVDAWMRDGQVVALHCKAGLGRTGTMLACQLIFEGTAPVRAVELARQINPAWIQSSQQVEFLTDLARHLPPASCHHANVRGS